MQVTVLLWFLADRTGTAAGIALSSVCLSVCLSVCSASVRPSVWDDDDNNVRQSQCATVGDRACATAGVRLWNSLPADIVACDILPQFRRELKTFLFKQSYPSILL